MLIFFVLSYSAANEWCASSGTAGTIAQRPKARTYTDLMKCLPKQNDCTAPDSGSKGATLRHKLNHRDERVLLFLLPRARAIRQFVIEALDKFFDLPLHGLHFGAHVQDDFDARQIDAEIARQMQNHFEPFEIFVGVEPRVPVAAAGLQQAFTL